MLSTRRRHSVIVKYFADGSFAALIINHCKWLIDCVNAVPFLLKGEARGGSDGRELGTVCLSFSLFRSSEADLAEERLLVLQKVPSEGS